MPLDERPAAAGRENSWAERLFYLAVAAVWAYSISASLEPLGAGGSHSRRDLGAFLLPLLTISAFLVGCAATSGGSRVGRLARWLAIAGIFLGIAGLVPLLAMFAFWLVAACSARRRVRRLTCSSAGYCRL